MWRDRERAGIGAEAGEVFVMLMFVVFLLRVFFAHRCPH